MYTFEKCIFINRPQQEVFDFVTDPANHTLWQRTTLSSEWAPDESPGVGSTIKSVVKLWMQDRLNSLYSFTLAHDGIWR